MGVPRSKVCVSASVRACVRVYVNSLYIRLHPTIVGPCVELGHFLYILKYIGQVGLLEAGTFPGSSSLTSLLGLPVECIGSVTIFLKL